MIKKYLLFFPCLLLFLLSASSQDTRAWGYFGQKIDIKDFTNDSIQLEAKIKSITNDTSCIARLYISFYNKKSKLIISYHDPIASNPIQNSWESHAMKIKIPKGAIHVIVGGQYSNKGLYFYDDFKLHVIAKGKLETSKNLIENGSFEEDSLQKFWTYIYLPSLWFKEGLTTKESFSGKQSLQVDGRTYTKLIQYGNNDSVGKSILVNGINLYYEVYGKGEPLLLLHGNGQSIGSFSQQIYAFKKNYTVYAVDTRGHGKSSEDGKKYSYDLFAEDIDAFLDALHLKNINIVGWSDGGNTGLILAMKHPEKVKALITMGANIFINHTVVEKKVFKSLKRGIKYFEKDTSYSAQNKVRLFQLLQTEPNYRFEDLKKIQCPVLVMAGQKDIIKEAHSRGIANAIPKGQLTIVPNATHFLPQENRDLFNKIVLAYFENGKLYQQ